MSHASLQVYQAWSTWVKLANLMIVFLRNLKLYLHIYILISRLKMNSPNAGISNDRMLSISCKWLLPWIVFLVQSIVSHSKNPTQSTSFVGWNQNLRQRCGRQSLEDKVLVHQDCDLHFFNFLLELFCHKAGKHDHQFASPHLPAINHNANIGGWCSWV